MGNINAGGIYIILSKRRVSGTISEPPAEGRFSLLVLTALEEYLGLSGYEYFNGIFREKTGLSVDSHVNLIREVYSGKQDLPKWYAHLTLYLSGLEGEQCALSQLIKKGFDNGTIALLTGKQRGESLQAIVRNNLWGAYMRQHHTGKNALNPRDDTELLSLALQGLSLKAMGERLGITKQGVSYLLHKRPEIYQAWKEAKEE